MSQIIWKIVLEQTDMQEVEVPDGAEFLTAREQMEQICLWFKCDPDRPRVKRRIIIHGTGHEFVGSHKYIGTGFLYGGQLVLHVFEG